jgi:hypothetical protein
MSQHLKRNQSKRTVAEGAHGGIFFWPSYLDLSLEYSVSRAVGMNEPGKLKIEKWQ